MQSKTLLIYCSFIVALLFLGCQNDQTNTHASSATAPETNKAITLYTSRYYILDKELFDKFEKLYKVKVNVVLDNADNLLARLKKEATNPQADLVLTSNLQDIYAIKDANLLTTFSDPLIDDNTHSRNQDKQGMWVGLSKWAMGVGGAHKRVPYDAFSTYADLTNKKFKQKIVVSSSQNKSNQFMIATMLITEGEAATRNWIKGIMANLAQPPLPTDVEAVKAVGSGYADLSIINTSALIQYQHSGVPEDFKVGSNVGIKYPVNSKNGTYYNLTPIGIVKGTKHYQDALNLILFLIAKEQQPTFCQSLHEYPVNVFAEIDDFIIGIGGFNEETIDFNKVIKSIPQAISIMNEYNWK